MKESKDFFNNYAVKKVFSSYASVIAIYFAFVAICCCLKNSGVIQSNELTLLAGKILLTFALVIMLFGVLFESTSFLILSVIFSFFGGAITIITNESINSEQFANSVLITVLMSIVLVWICLCFAKTKRRLTGLFYVGILALFTSIFVISPKLTLLLSFVSLILPISLSVKYVINEKDDWSIYLHAAILIWILYRVNLYLMLIFY